MSQDDLTEFEKLINSINQFATLVIAYYNALVEGGKEIIGLNKK